MYKKILIILPSPYVGGCEKFGVEQAKFLAKNGFLVFIAIPGRDQFSNLIQSLSNSEIKIFKADCYDFSPSIKRSFWFRARAFINTTRVALNTKPDLVIISRPSPLAGFSSSLSTAILGIPSIGIFQLVHEEHKLPAWQINFSKWALKHNQVWVAVSDNNRQLISNLYGVNKHIVRLVYNGSTFPKLSHSQSFRNKLNAQLNVDSGAQLLLTVGALTYQKGHDILLKAFSMLHDEFSSAHLVWLGEGSFRKDLEVMVNDLGLQGRVHMLGQQSNVAEFLQASDLFVFPTRFEGFPFALLEAMAAEKPIVATNISSIPELVRDGKEGILCKPDDPESLAEALKYALQNIDGSLQELAKAARLRSQKFTKEKMMNEHLKLIKSMLSE